MGIAATHITCVAFVNPSEYGIDTLPCMPSGNPLVSLKADTLFGVRRGAHRFRVLATRSNPMPGAPDTLCFADSGAVWSVFVISATDKRSSCRSVEIGVNLTADVPEGEPRAPPLELFDLAGRRITGTPRPGVYFRRSSSGARVVVVLK